MVRYSVVLPALNQNPNHVATTVNRKDCLLIIYVTEFKILLFALLLWQLIWSLLKI